VKETWKTVEQLVTWLDTESTTSPEVNRLLRVLKISEEAGEVAEAVQGVAGHNPRKGRSHTWEDVEAELCDVILTAMVALRSITPDAAKVFEKRLAYVAGRSLGPPGAAPPAEQAHGDADGEAADVALAREAEAALAEGGPTVTLAELVTGLVMPGDGRGPRLPA
jgi:NTP pyrophosphatase (non-canonical NTP hydrolase)